MRSKKVIILCLSMLLISCQRKEIPRHQKVLPEEQSLSHSEDKRTGETNRDEFKGNLEVEALIKSGKESSYLEATSILNNRIFGKKSNLSETYTSKKYVYDLTLYVKLFKIWRASDDKNQFKSEFKNSLELFKQRFVDPCVEDGAEICEMAQKSLKQNSSTVELIHFFAKKEKNLAKRLKIIGLAYDISGRREEVSLNSYYIETVISSIGSVDWNRLGKPLQKKSLHNILNLVSIKDWSHLTEANKNQIKMIKPWLYEEGVSGPMAELRERLFPYIVIYVKDDEIRQAVEERLNVLISKAERNKYDLSNYPAFEDIQLSAIKNELVEVSFLLVNLYFQNIKIDAANGYLELVEDKSLFIDKSFKVSKLLVRWDVAQLSIYSTKEINKKFQQKKIKTKAFIQETLDYSKNLTPVWTEFHTSRLWSIRTYLSAHKHQSENVDDNVLQRFFGSVNRNILKTAVYPNMFGFAYHMAKTEWKDLIRILWFEIEIDSTDVFELMATGDYRKPWFNFTNLQIRAERKKDNKTSLFRSEVVDSLYYMFATRTHEDYGFSVDEFFKTAATTILKKRANILENVSDLQKEMYFSTGARALEIVEWCDGLSQGRPVRESIQFYELESYLTPFNVKTRELDNNASKPYLYGDVYKGRLLKGTHRFDETTDRLRGEIVPILNFFNRLEKMVKRLEKQHKSFVVGGLQSYNNYLSYVKKVKRNYLSIAKSASKILGDCTYVASSEVRRRAQKVTLGHKAYLEEAVYPLLKRVADGGLSVSLANEILKNIHGNPAGFTDEIMKSSSGEVQYTISKMGFFLRTKQLLTKGMLFKTDLLNLEISPVVGRYLKIPIPGNVLTDTGGNPYISNDKAYKNDRVIPLDVSTTAEEFSARAIRLTTDEVRGDYDSSIKFTNWDRYDGAKYDEYNRSRIEFLVQMHLLGPEKYVDLTRRECRKTNISKLPQGCLLVNSVTQLDIAKEMKKVYSRLILSTEDREYFKLINGRGYESTSFMYTALKVDDSISYRSEVGALPFQKLAGLFDLPLKMMRSSHLGLVFLHEYETYLETKTPDGPSGGSDHSCSGQRDGCHWANDVDRARDFFVARLKRPGLIFNFDKKILTDEFLEVKKESLLKFNRALEFEKRSDELFEEVMTGEDRKVYYSIYREPENLYPLRRNYRQGQFDFDQFFVEETENYFLSTPNWKEYLYH